VLERDEGICHICGAVVDENKWHLDHIVPISKGGAHSYTNVATSHPKCNLEKGAGW
jgi:5-methylcytosine-specific restriction endonuclease McrA